nr:putative Ig domain-containing protein [Ralstonia sp. A12]
MLTQNSPLGRHGVAGWSTLQRLGAVRRAWMQRCLLAMLTAWLALLSQGAAGCSVAFPANVNTQTTYQLSNSDLSNCDPVSLGIAYNNQGQSNPAASNPGMMQATSAGGLISVYVDVNSGAEGFVYYAPPNFSGNDTAPFYNNVDGTGWVPSTVNISVTGSTPTVTGLSTSTGTAAGGTSVTITGTNLFRGPMSTVWFGSTRATSVNIVSSTQINAVSPPGSGVVDVSVSTFSGTSTVSGADKFTYVAAPTAGATSTTVAHGSTSNVVPLNVTGSPTSVAVAAQPTHGTATASGTTITYTPNASYSGPDSLTYTATNAGGTSVPATVSITVSDATVAYTASPPSGGTVGVAYSQSLASASGGTAPYTYALASGTLPAGLALASNGTLSGTPTSSGSFNFSITATDSSTGTGPFTGTSGNVALTIAQPVIIVSPATLPMATVASAYSQTVSASGGTAPYTYAVTAGNLPAGLTLSSGGVISGTPTAGGVFNFAVTATDHTGGAGPYISNQVYSLTVNATTLSIAPSAGNLSATAGTPYSQSFTGSGGTSPYIYSFSINSGSLPTGLSFNTGTGTLSGTPTTSGTVNFTVTARDNSTGTGPYTVASTYTLTTAAPTITVSPASLANGTVGVAYSQTASAGGGTAPYTYAVTTGALPAGLSLNSSTGAITGTPTAGGVFNVIVTATDANGYTGTRNYGLSIAAPAINVNPVTLPGATTGAAYSQSMSTSGGTSPYGYVISVGSLPPGMTLTSTGTLSGTPTAGGTFNFSITSTDNSTGTGAPYTGSRAYALTVAAPTLTMTPASGALNAMGGTAFSRSFSVAGGTGPYTYVTAISSGTLPAGLVLNAGTATLSGTPTTAGTVSFTVTATDSSTGSGPYAVTGTYTLTVSAPTISITPAMLPNPAIATAYSQTVTASGGTGPYSYTIMSGALPTGLSLSSGGALSGTPTAGGTFNFTIKATDANSFSGSQSYSVTVGAPTLTLTPSSSSFSATLSQAFSQTFAGSGGTAPYRYSISTNAGTLPTGVTFNTATGTLAGTPTTPGTVNFTVTATDSSTGLGPFSTSGTYTLTAVAPTISVSPATLPNPTIATAYSQTATAGGGTAPYTYAVTAGALPAGLNLNSSTGAISGTPTAGGAFNVTVTATDANGYTGTRNFGLSVAAATVTVSPGTVPGATVGTAYTQSMTASGGTAPYTYAVTAGALPVGMTVSSAGALSGTPTAGGSFNFTITSTDSSTGTGAPYTGGRAYTLTVASPTLAITPASGALNGVAGTAYGRNFSASGGIGPYTYAMTVNAGTMPTGLVWNAGTATLAGTPTTAGTVNFTITATDSSTGSGPYAVGGTYTLAVSAPTIAVAPATLPAPAIATAYSQTVSASSGTAPYTYAITAGALPTGLSLSSSTGAITGTPTAGGTFNFTVTATDANRFTATRVYSFSIGAPTVSVSPAAAAGATINTAYSQTFSAAGGTAPYTFAVSTGTLPAGLSLNASTGVLSGTPTALGTSTFTVQASDSSTGASAPYSGTRSYTIVMGQVIGTAPATVVSTLSNAPVTLHPTANATGGPFSSVVIVSPPASGTAVVNGLDIVYTPTPTTSGAINFTYALVNTAGTSAPIAATVNVSAVPIAAVQKLISTSSGQAVSVDLTEGATGGPFTGAALVSVVPSNAGTASIVQKTVQTPAGVKTTAAAASTYMLNFTPASTYSGPAVLTYTLSNAYATSTPATVQVSVAARKDPSADPDVAGLINAQIQAARRFATTQIDNYNRRLEALHGTGRAPSDNGLTVAMPGQRTDMRARCQDVAGIAAYDACLRGDGQGRSFARGKRNPDAAKDGDKSNADAGPDLPGADVAGSRADSTDTNLAFWSAGTLDFGFANMGAQRSGFRFTTGGVTAGADYRVSDQLSVGAGFGYGRDSTDIGNAGTKSTGDSYSLALYGSYRPQPSVFVDGVAGFGTLSFDSRRWVTDASDFATGRRNGRQMFASVSAGYEHRDRTWLISPYGRLSVSQSTLDQFSESGAGINALTYFEQTVTTVSGTLGLRAEYAQKTKWGTFLPFARVEYQHDFNGQSNAGLAYADLASSGPAYYVPGTPFGRDRVQIGLGTKFRTGPLTFGLDYNVMTGMGGLQQGVRLTFSAPF